MRIWTGLPWKEEFRGIGFRAEIVREEEGHFRMRLLLGEDPFCLDLVGLPHDLFAELDALRALAEERGEPLFKRIPPRDPYVE